MNTRQIRLAETFKAMGGPVARLCRSLREDIDAITRSDEDKSGHDLLATDALIQRFQQVADLTLRKLFPRLLGAMEETDTLHPLGAMLDRLDGYEAISDVPWWLELNAARNRLVHEYAMEPLERSRELALAVDLASRLHAEVCRVLEDRALGKKVFGHD